MRPVVHLVFKLRCLKVLFNHWPCCKDGKKCFALFHPFGLPSPWCCIQALLSSNLTLSPICSHSIPNPLRQPEEIRPFTGLFTLATTHTALYTRIYSLGEVDGIRVAVVTILGPAREARLPGGVSGSWPLRYKHSTHAHTSDHID